MIHLYPTHHGWITSKQHRTFDTGSGVWTQVFCFHDEYLMDWALSLLCKWRLTFLQTYMSIWKLTVVRSAPPQALPAYFSVHFGWHPLLSSPRFLPVIYCPSTAPQTELFKTTSCLIFAESLPVGHSLPQHGIPRLELPTPHQFWQGRESSLQPPCYAHQIFSGSFASSLADTLVLATLMKKKKKEPLFPHELLLNQVS